LNEKEVTIIGRDQFPFKYEIEEGRILDLKEKSYKRRLL
jgi:hypothetical protein